MDNISFAAQAVADGPMTIAPPSFDGHGWLVVINLAAATAATLIGIMVLVTLINDWTRGHDRRWSPAWVLRLDGVLFASGITLRCGVEALTLWGWNPADPVATGGYLTAKRMVDPFAIGFGISGLLLLILSLPGLLRQLRREPFAVPFWQAWPIVRSMIWVGVMTLVASVGVVSTR